MSELFPPIHGINQIEYYPQSKVYSHKKDVVRIYSDKAVTITAEFTTYDKEGNVIDILSSKYFDIKCLKNFNKLKDVWIYGYSFKKSSELKNTKFLEAAKKITNYKKIKINGISYKTIMKI